MRLPRSNSPGGNAVGLPYNRKNIEEWSRIDRRTGVREKAKIETDHWTARSNNAAHNYGKVRVCVRVHLRLQRTLRNPFF